MKKKDLKQERGITLIALIITIIILVILAAVSIRAVYNMGIVGHAINGTQQYAEASKAENEMLGQTVTKLEDAVAKVKEIQEGKEKGLILDTNSGIGQDGNTKYVIALPKDEMTMEEFASFYNSDIEVVRKYENWELAYLKGYKPSTTTDQNGIDFNELTKLTNDTILSIQWEKTNEARFNSIVTIDANGGHINCMSNRTVYIDYADALFKSPFIMDIAEKDGYVMNGYYYDRECTQKIDVENLTDEEILALDGKTVYIGWEEPTRTKTFTIEYGGHSRNSNICKQ